MLSRLRDYDLFINPPPSSYDPIQLHAALTPFSQRAWEHHEQLPTKTVGMTHDSIYDDDGNLIEHGPVFWEAFDWSNDEPNRLEPHMLDLLYGDNFADSLHAYDDSTLSDNELRTWMITCSFMVVPLVSIPFEPVAGLIALPVSFLVGRGVSRVVNRIAAAPRAVTSAMRRTGIAVLPATVRTGHGFNELTVVEFVVSQWRNFLAPRPKAHCLATTEIIRWLHLFGRDPGLVPEPANSIAINDYRFLMLPISFADDHGPTTGIETLDGGTYRTTPKPPTVEDDILTMLFVLPMFLLNQMLWKPISVGLPLLIGPVRYVAAAAVLSMCCFPNNPFICAGALTILAIAYVQRAALYACHEYIQTLPLSPDSLLNFYRSMFSVCKRTCLPLLVIAGVLIAMLVVREPPLTGLAFVCAAGGFGLRSPVVLLFVFLIGYRSPPFLPGALTLTYSYLAIAAIAVATYAYVRLNTLTARRTSPAETV